MNIWSSIRSVLSEVTSLSSGVLVHAGNEYPVAKAFSTGDERAMLDAGYDPQEVDMVVLLDRANTHNMQTPKPGDICELDNVGYTIKSPVTSNTIFFQLPLRRIK